MNRHSPGDIVSRRKGPVMHRGIALDENRVLHNTPLKGEHVSTFADFCRGKPARVRQLGERERERALRYAAARRGRAYNPFTNNCEHTVTRATAGQARSPQLALIAGVGAAAAALVLTRHPGIAAAAFALGRGLAKRGAVAGAASSAGETPPSPRARRR